MSGCFHLPFFFILKFFYLCFSAWWEEHKVIFYPLKRQQQNKETERAAFIGWCLGVKINGWLFFEMLWFPETYIISFKTVLHTWQEQWILLLSLPIILKATSLVVNSWLFFSRLRLWMFQDSTSQQVVHTKLLVKRYVDNFLCGTEDQESSKRDV